MKKQISIRVSNLTTEQLKKLSDQLNLNQSEVILLAVERLKAQLLKEAVGDEK